LHHILAGINKQVLGIAGFTLRVCWNCSVIFTLTKWPTKTKPVKTPRKKKVVLTLQNFSRQLSE
jgi:hypothetical protein